MTSRMKRHLRTAGIPVPEPLPPKPALRHAACADDSENGGCHHFAPGTPEREACRTSCRLLCRPPPVRGGAASFLLMAGLLGSAAGGEK